MRVMHAFHASLSAAHIRSDNRIFMAEVDVGVLYQDGNGSMPLIWLR